MKNEGNPWQRAEEGKKIEIGGSYFQQGGEGRGIAKRDASTSI